MDEFPTSLGDGCSNKCLKEGVGCGDKAIQQGEECDDGNGYNTDACTNNCLFSKCGDGFVRAGMEECDDGNTVNTDG